MHSITFVYGERTTPITVKVRDVKIFTDCVVLGGTIKVPHRDIIQVRIQDNKQDIWKTSAISS